MNANTLDAFEMIRNWSDMADRVFHVRQEYIIIDHDWIQNYYSRA